MIRYLIPLGVFTSLVVALAIGMQLNPSHVPSPLVGKPAPHFSLPRVHDSSQQIGREDLQGQVTLLNVWASWCTSCRQEHPLLMELADSGRVVLYGLNYKDNRKDALRWLEKHGDPYRASAFDKRGNVGMNYGVYGVPETYIIGPKGIIRHKVIGPLTVSNLRDTVLPLIEELQG